MVLHISETSTKGEESKSWNTRFTRPAGGANQKPQKKQTREPRDKTSQAKRQAVHQMYVSPTVSSISSASMGGPVFSVSLSIRNCGQQGHDGVIMYATERRV